MYFDDITATLDPDTTIRAQFGFDRGESAPYHALILRQVGGRGGPGIWLWGTEADLSRVAEEILAYFGARKAKVLAQAKEISHEQQTA